MTHLSMLVKQPSTLLLALMMIGLCFLGFCIVGCTETASQPGATGSAESQQGEEGKSQEKSEETAQTSREEGPRQVEAMKPVIPEKPSTEMQTRKDIVDTAVAAGTFKTLAKALVAAKLIDTLKSEGPFTVFAPNDEAFAALPEGKLDELLDNPEELKQVLLYHVVPGRVLAAEVVKLDTAKTVNGQPLKIDAKNGKVMIDDAEVTQTDILCNNGVIHVIDAVLLPSEEKQPSTKLKEVPGKMMPEKTN